MEKPKRKNQMSLWRKRHIQAFFILALFSLVTVGMTMLTMSVTPTPTYDLPYVDPTITPDWYCDIGPTAYDRDDSASVALQSAMDEAGLMTIANVWYHIIGGGEVVCTNAPPSAATWGRAGVFPEVIFYVSEDAIDNPDTLGSYARILIESLDDIPLVQTPFDIVVYFVNGETTRYWRTRGFRIQEQLDTGMTNTELYDLGRYPYDNRFGREGLPRYQNR